MAERAYLKKYAQAWVNAGGSVGNGQTSSLKPAFVELHPRYEQLVKGLNTVLLLFEARFFAFCCLETFTKCWSRISSSFRSGIVERKEHTS